MSEINIPEIESAKGNLCIECTQKIQRQLAACLQAAGDDETKKRACNVKAAKDWTAQCKALCAK